MKILFASLLILGWLAIGFGAFTDQWDSITINTVTTGILAEDGGDDGLDETITRSLYGITAAFGSGTGGDKVTVINLFKKLLNTPSIPRYKMLCVYRL